MSMSLISWVVQSNIPYVGVSRGTANVLCAIVLLKVESLGFHLSIMRGCCNQYLHSKCSQMHIFNFDSIAFHLFIRSTSVIFLRCFIFSDIAFMFQYCETVNQCFFSSQYFFLKQSLSLIWFLEYYFFSVQKQPLCVNFFFEFCLWTPEFGSAILVVSK